MDWKKDYLEGVQFAKTAKGMDNKNKVDNQTLYHVISMAVEKYATALAAYLSYIPEHSELNFIFKELSEKIKLPESFINEIRFMNGFMTYCSLDFEEPKEVSDADKERMLSFMDELSDFSEKTLGVIE